ncbi:hypothetical protein MEN41_15280 [Dolichospermum sp. ST_con]|jgi:hypothetical protein|nr:hypothetical protein [Dolichospermum sp. ST_con]MDD1420840.1 hypothetical protein [Dolichospermum sp. ST_sed1]MDD1423046.1 hypothetical protein [Dolichospermum sp. ST_sed9]MDD1432482.1 hypothetical protein [Dolichospermum sp. ST_sed6]MDD1436315.1 hypothetical protein [Dolichospermum sp. ST_sed10]MDD1442398.1 hypothetical protein [Dolichospermum sp. ST_sed3]MDD1447843.1 hypothetical protein [Dolichospermum sp. ST_sed8]MDD1453456.1 hypothetical protein [Dolichospermum sp. ST_sed7]MDD146216
MLLVLSLHQKKELNNTTLAFILGVIGVVISFLIPTEEKVIDEDSKKPSTLSLSSDSDSPLVQENGKQKDK